MAYDKDAMTTDTREVLLYGQLQEGLHYELIKSPAVSGAQSYKELCIAAQNEEKYLTGLRKWQTYIKGSTQEFRRQSTPSSKQNCTCSVREKYTTHTIISD